LHSAPVDLFTELQLGGNPVIHWVASESIFLCQIISCDFYHFIAQLGVFRSSFGFFTAGFLAAVPAFTAVLGFALALGLAGALGFASALAVEAFFGFTVFFSSAILVPFKVSRIITTKT